MNERIGDIEAFLGRVHPYNSLTPDELSRVASATRRVDRADGERIYTAGQALDGLYLIVEGTVEVADADGALVSILGPGNSFGERGLLRDGRAATSATARKGVRLCLLPAAEFQRLARDNAVFARFFDRSRSAEPRVPTLSSTRVVDLMSPDPVTCSPDTAITDAARKMRARGVSSLLVSEAGALLGIVTDKDLTRRALAEALPGDTPVSRIMTPDPAALGPDAIGFDVLHEMVERRIGHLPVVADGRLIGVVTQTDLTRRQALSAAHLIREIAGCETADALAGVVARVPDLLVQLVATGHDHVTTCRMITDIADATTRRLLALAEASLGPPPAPYLWLACGSQGRREQTGISDQDNCLLLDDAARPRDDAYFAALAGFVSDGLAACGYYYCPGDMMATNARWRQPVHVWRRYFQGWIDTPDPMAQMLASVMFDLRPIGGTMALFQDLNTWTLKQASANSIFLAHMVSNSLKHAPPLGLIGGLATIRSGEHKNTLDLKLNGVVPVVDLARVYALQGRIGAVNTKARLEAALSDGVISRTGGRDLIDAFDLICETRLGHQAARIKAGEKPNNFMLPATLSDLERSHLRDAFVVVKTMQSALRHGRAAMA